MAIETVDTRLRARRRGRGRRAGRQLAPARLGAARRRRRRSAFYGLYAIDGITKHDSGGSAVSRQGLYAAVGALLFVAALFVDPTTYRRFHRTIYFGTLGLMGLVLVAGAASHGSTRWIDIGFFAFQPSEFGKVLFVLALAGVLADRSVPITSAQAPLRALAVRRCLRSRSSSSSPTSEPRSCTSPRSAGVLFFAGVRWLHLAVLFVVTVVGALLILWLLPSAGVNVLKPYQTARLTGFTHPSNDPRGATYNLRQSITAVGAGGLRGRGVLGATQTRLNYLPAHSTDFAFASLAEEHGFFGAVDPVPPLPARRLESAQGGDGRARSLQRHRRRRQLPSCSCSRCS